MKIYSSVMPSSAILHSENVNLEGQAIVIKYLFLACSDLIPTLGKKGIPALIDL